MAQTIVQNMNTQHFVFYLEILFVKFIRINKNNKILVYSVPNTPAAAFDASFWTTTVFGSEISKIIDGGCEKDGLAILGEAGKLAQVGNGNKNSIFSKIFLFY